MGKVTKLTLTEFAEKISTLEVGEYFYFTIKAERDEELQRERKLEKLCAVQKLYLLGRKMVMISENGRPGYDTFWADSSNFTESIRIFLDKKFHKSNYFVEDEIQKREATVSLTPEFCIDIKNCTYCGKSVLIPSRKVHELAEDIDKYYVATDLVSKAEEMGSLNDLTQEDINRMAETVIKRRDNCCVISDACWQIVEEVLHEFLTER